MSLINGPTDLKSTPESTEESVHHHQVSLIPKLTDTIVKSYLEFFTGKTLMERVAIIQDSNVPEDVKFKILKPYLTQRLKKVKSDAAVLSLFQEIESFCLVKVEGEKNSVFSDALFQDFYKPLLKEFVQKIPTECRQKLNILNLAEHAEDNAMKEMLGTWYLCTIDNDEEFNSFLENQVFIKEIAVGSKFHSEGEHYQIMAKGARALAEALKKNNTLTSLDLCANLIGPEGAGALAEALKVNSTLTSLNLKFNQIGDEGTRALAEALKENHTLTDLSLCRNSIGAEGARALAEALKENHTLTGLNLSCNQIATKGTRALAEVLKENSTLTGLSLWRNSIGAEGTRALAEALKENHTLTGLNLEDNQIGPEGAGALAEALKENHTLTDLNLGDNYIGAEGAGALAEALKVNSTLTTLCLGFNNQIRDAGAHALAEALKKNSTLTSLYLSYNQINTEDTRAALREVKALYPSREIHF